MTATLRQVSLPAELCSAAENKFGNLETFLTFVLREVLRDDAYVLDEKEQRIVEERLRDLGYM